ncbi:CDP-glycerol glycerophosphotransferase family protein [Mammaliicoccus sciuri]|uniref:CDP-glycerol glycerophosphotransferase family protein n=1 Tax=Mammaliicoccus sciuri TaxID=1296 RepID=UPI001E417A42|nr:CDP-glycerol glycerophosphotransferase family protein [Mammaliicoccus sciuri]MCD8893273.1 CDP-glycerol glycerophosphotransferase family protein [Mammaliicoccus sciuri]MCD8911437.1 CDP-glycerol glycerophosphotransferase family protein [Mammaliicoccus sciuri]
MKVLQVLFDLKNKNIDSFNERLNDQTFYQTIVLDVSNDQDINIDTNEFDYILFSNPNFTCDGNNFINTLKKMEVEQKQIAQYTLMNKENTIDYQYNSGNYRDLFSSCIVDTRLFNTHDLLEIFFAAKKSTLNQNMLIVESNYIGRNTKNIEYREDLINLMIKLLDYTTYEELQKIFESESELINFLDLMIDNKIFEKALAKKIKLALLKRIRTRFSEFDLLTSKEHTPLYLIYSLTMKSYYEEAIQALTLYRSEKYWRETYEKYAYELGFEDDNVRETDAWKKTQRLRDVRINLKTKYYKVEKTVLKNISNVLKLFNKQQVWLLSERRNSASDNTFYLFKYLMENDKKVRPYYLIEKNAGEPIKKLKKLKKYGNIVYFGSLKHKLYMLLADKFVTSFTFEETMTPFNAEQYKEIYANELNKKKIISIQHGMIIHNISPYLSKHQYRTDYITANSIYEKAIIKDTLGFKDDEILITGMARHDNLLINSKRTNQILFMPTWQRGLQNLSESQFLETEYFKKIHELVNDTRIINYLKENRLKICVLMHPQFEKFSKHFKNDNELIKYVSTTEVEIPDLIANSVFLITDFSSVAVDFLFQKKNVIFYQYNKYASHHVPSKQIEYSDIGTIVVNLEEMLDSLQEIEKHNYDLLPNFIDSYEKLFEVKTNIRETIVENIKNL